MGEKEKEGKMERTGKKGRGVVHVKLRSIYVM